MRRRGPDTEFVKRAAANREAASEGSVVEAIEEGKAVVMREAK
jgi:hypothetical protein